MIDKLTTHKAELCIKKFLRYMGQDVKREGLRDTPARYVKFFKEFIEKREFNLTTFTAESKGLVIVKDIPFYSMCEHHLAPFFGVAHIAYYPNKKIAGLSKLPRVLDKFACQPQNQERITKEVCNYLYQTLDADGVAVVIEARHMCMEMRGVKKCGVNTRTSEYVGTLALKDRKEEFLNSIK